MQDPFLSRLDNSPHNEGGPQSFPDADQPAPQLTAVEQMIKRYIACRNYLQTRDDVAAIKRHIAAESEGHAEADEDKILTGFEGLDDF